MKKLFILLVGVGVVALNIFCNHSIDKSSLCSKDTVLTLGKIKIILSNCYKIIHQEKEGYTPKNFLVRNDSIKLEFSTEGISKSLPEQNEKSQTDTLEKIYLRQIESVQNGDKFYFQINIVDLRVRNDTTLFPEKKYLCKLSAHTFKKCLLTKEEKDLLIKSFKNCSIEK